jgi:hypothetical protein
MASAVRVALVAALVLLFPASSKAQVRVDRNIVYGMYSDLALLMDVHLAAGMVEIFSSSLVILDCQTTSARRFGGSIST